MRRTCATLIAVFLVAALHSRSIAQTTDSAALEKVLKKMDAASASFRSAQADFVWDQYQKVVNETDTQTGTVYYRRVGKEIEMMAEIKQPDRKFVLYKGGKLQVYQPKIEQVMQYSTAGNGSEIESYLVLGFGGSGEDLAKTFDVSFEREESISGVNTAKLQLIPKSEKVRNSYFSKVFLWIDMESGISVQQQFMQTQGDYRLAKYANVRVNTKIGGDVFQLKTTSKTKFVSPRG